MKGVFVVIDGAADLPVKSLGNKTPLEVAKTPNLDRFTRKGKLDYTFTVGEGIAPQSHNAVLSLLGYDPTLIPRGPLEAIGAGIHIKKGDLVLRTNFATIDDLESGTVLDRRAGRTLTTKEAHALADAVNKQVKLKYPFEFHATNQHRGVLVFRGGFSDNISNVDPGYGNGVALKESSKLRLSHAIDDEEDSKVSAELLNNFVRRSHEVLDKHPLNLVRAKKGLFAANVILCRDAGNEPPKLKKMKGKWMALGYMPLEKGIARAAGMDLYKFKYPRLRGSDVYGNLYHGLHLAIKNAVRMIWWNRKKYDYFYVHFKETDIPGHDGKPEDKIRMIELIDENFFGYLVKTMRDEKLMVTADHTTACSKKAHTSDPVPVLACPAKKSEQDQRFTEAWAQKGKKIQSRNILSESLY